MQPKYEDGKTARVGDTGSFTYGNDDGGYRYDGIVTNISKTGRLEIRTVDGYPVTLIMADQVIHQTPA